MPFVCKHQKRPAESKIPHKFGLMNPFGFALSYTPNQIIIIIVMNKTPMMDALCAACAGYLIKCKRDMHKKWFLSTFQYLSMRCSILFACSLFRLFVPFSVVFRLCFMSQRTMQLFASRLTTDNHFQL